MSRAWALEGALTFDDGEDELGLSEPSHAEDVDRTAANNERSGVSRLVLRLPISRSTSKRGPGGDRGEHDELKKQMASR